MTARLSCVRLAYGSGQIAETMSLFPTCPTKDFIPLFFLFLACGHVLALWVIALYAALCEVVWRAPAVLCCGAVRLWHRMSVYVRARPRFKGESSVGGHRSTS